MLGVQRNAGHRAHLHALRLVEVADAFGALVRVDLVDLRPRKMASFGHSGSHTSQLMHSSVIMRAIIGGPIAACHGCTAHLFWHYPRGMSLFLFKRLITLIAHAG
jgi:hypothetical protein